MPRGRHRHSPPLHRLLPPSAIAGVSFVCAFGPWVFSQQAALRVIAAIAAATAVVGAAVMRRWDAQAGKQVADLTRARASDEWRHEERVAELETDLEESRELRTKLEQRLRAKRAELAGLRNEHAALLRRYATAETERASALEGRRLLEIEAGTPTRALPPVPVPVGDVEATEAVEATEDVETGAVAASVDAEGVADAVGPEGTADAVGPEDVAGAAEATDIDEDEAADGDETEEAAAVFSPEGSRLFLRANAALKRFDEDGSSEEGASVDAASEDASAADADADPEADPEEVVLEGATAEDAPGDDDSRDNGSRVGDSRDGDSPDDASVKGESEGEGGEQDGTSPDDDGSPKGDGPTRGDRSAKRRQVKASAASAAREAAATRAGTAPMATEAAVDGGSEAAAQEDEARGKPVAADGHERAAATTSGKYAPSAQQPAGHFVAPTAVAVVPPTPARPAVEGGFDFFGTKTEPSPDAIEDVQNQDLADVVGEEALAVHKAESEAEFKPADEQARGVGQVIDLTAHDETEQIDVQGLRSAVS
ncbi:hypothetical protein AB0H97_38060 [Streptomyces sp. NPDC050788]|uniref:hypothetical protein n=1 Tax=Streptomyces sp. NPDC050788 TaxID=3155041 RepID=UPI00342F9057